MEKLTTNENSNTFASQFSIRERISTAGGIAEVVDIKPKNQKDEVPTLFAPAWACTLPVYEPALQTLTEQGRRVISLNHPRLGGNMELTPEQEKLVEKYPREEVRKALTVLDVLSYKGVQKTDVIGHSEGALNAAIAALLQPERFRNLVFFWSTWINR